MADEVSIDVPESVVDSVDEVLTWAGLPEAGPLVERVSPANAAETVGVPTPRDFAESIRRDIDNAIGFEMDEGRR